MAAAVGDAAVLCLEGLEAGHLAGARGHGGGLGPRGPPGPLGREGGEGSGWVCALSLPRGWLGGPEHKPFSWNEESRG